MYIRQSRENENAILAIVAIGGILLVAGILKFSQLIGVNFQSGAEVAVRLAMVIAIPIVIAKFSDAVHIGQLVPLIAAGIWFAFWPAIDYWANPMAGALGGEDAFWAQLHESWMPWWATWYAKIGGLIVIAIFTTAHRLLCRPRSY